MKPQQLMKTKLNKKQKSNRLRIIKLPEAKPQPINTVGIHPGICFKCGRKIYLDENYLKLVTMNKGKIHEEAWFCLPKCWQEFNQEKVNERMKQIASLGLNAIRSRMNY